MFLFFWLGSLGSKDTLRSYSSLSVREGSSVRKVLMGSTTGNL